jgi:hypothetical protein
MEFIMRSIFLIMVVLVFASCEKVINIDLNDSMPVLVIEANVTDEDRPQLVSVTRTKSVSDPNSPVSVVNAEVSIADDEGKVYLLNPVSPGNYATNAFIGVPGKTYHLKVSVDGKEYTASSTMPALIAIDSMRIGTSNFAGVESKSIEVIYNDPEEFKNFYRYKLSVNGNMSKNIFVYNDEFTNGRTVYRELIDFEIGIDPGDSVAIQMECIDKNIYRYWSGLAQNQNRGGASTTPANPVSNISNGALGYFSAHTIQRRKVKVP